MRQILEKIVPAQKRESVGPFEWYDVSGTLILGRPRHVKVQILGDKFGAAVQLGERGTIRFRGSHQKMIEKSPYLFAITKEIKKK